MSNNNVDTKLLISEVEKRTIIWDTSHEDYKDKNKKNEAWIEVCSTLIENFVTTSEAKQKLIRKYCLLYYIINYYNVIEN